MSLTENAFQYGDITAMRQEMKLLLPPGDEFADPPRVDLSNSKPGPIFESAPAMREAVALARRAAPARSTAAPGTDR